VVATFPEYYAVTIEVTATTADPSASTIQDFSLGVFYTPQQTQDAYGLNTITGIPVSALGKGQTVVIVADEDAPNLVSSTDPNFKYSDLAQFDKLTGLNAYASPNAPTFLKLNMFGGTNNPAFSTTTTSKGKINAGAGEITQDVESVHALAPYANIVLLEYTGGIGGQLTADQTAQTVLKKLVGLTPAVVSNSFGIEEGVIPPASIWLGANFYNNPATPQPMTYVFTAGDFDKTDCHQVDYREAMGVVVAGYTQLTTSASGQYGSEAVVLGSGGGASAYGPQLLWQNGVVNQVSTTMQANPDVSLNGASASALGIYDSYTDSRNTSGVLDSTWEAGNGTSLAAPQWAAMFAIADQVRANAKLPALTDAQTLTLLYSNAGPKDFHQIGQLQASTDRTPTPTLSAAFGDFNPWAGLGSPKANVLLPAMSQPTVHVSSQSLNLGTTLLGTAGPTESFTLSGVNLAGPITIRAPFGTQVSLNGTTWQSSLSFTPDADIPNTIIYVSISPTAPAGAIGGAISNVSGSINQRVLVNGEVTGLAVIPVSVQPLSYAFNSASNLIIGTFLVRNDGPAVTGTFVLAFPTVPSGVTVVGQSAFQGTLGTGSYVLTVSFTPASAPYLGLLLKAKNPAGDVLYPAELFEVPAITPKIHRLRHAAGHIAAAAWTARGVPG
jgi:hypothetical protein